MAAWNKGRRAVCSFWRQRVQLEILQPSIVFVAWNFARLSQIVLSFIHCISDGTCSLAQVNWPLSFWNNYCEGPDTRALWHVSCEMRSFVYPVWWTHIFCWNLCAGICEFAGAWTFSIVPSHVVQSIFRASIRKKQWEDCQSVHGKIHSNEAENWKFKAGTIPFHIRC